MKIGISGAHSMGKTTIVDALRERTEFKDFTFCESPTRSLAAQGLSINEVGTEVTQMYIMAKHYENSKIHGNVVLDRCALDGLAYTSVVLSGFNDPDFKNALGVFGRRCFEAYDLIFYVRPELELVSDGTRTVDPEFFNKIVDSFKYWIDAIKFYKHAPAVVELHGSVDQRVQQILNTLKFANLNIN